MTIQPLKMNVMQQGGLAFPYVSTWNDLVQASSGSPVSYDLSPTARIAMGLSGKESLFIIFAADAPFWANFYGSAALPSGNITNGTASEFSPNQRYIDQSISAISFIAPNTANISLQVYRP